MMLVGVSLFAGASCCVRTWMDWSGEQPGGIGEHARMFISYGFWEAVLDSYLHKLLILNAGCCLLYLLGKALQELLLGPLREMEAMKVSPLLTCADTAAGRGMRTGRFTCAMCLRRWANASGATHWSRWCLLGPSCTITTRRR